MRADVRTSMLELCRPPDGYRLRAGIGSTYSADLDVLVAALLALAGAEDCEDPATQNDAVMRIRSAFRLFVNRGSLRAGPRRQLLALFDSIVVEESVKGASFHPKVWALEFEPEEGTAAGEPLRYRLICSSRNLSNARTWELAARLDGEAAPQGRQVDPLAANVARFLERLLVSPRLPHDLAGLPNRIRQATFAAIGGRASSHEFLWQGLGKGTCRFRLPKRASRILVVSPFLNASFLTKIEKIPDITLVSTQDSLDKISAIHFKPKHKLYVVSGADTTGGSGALDLHAKLVVWECGKKRVSLVGSANATTRGFGLAKGVPKNVEAMLRMEPGIDCARFMREFISQPWVSKYVRKSEDTSRQAEKEAQRLLQLLSGKIEFRGTWTAASTLLQVKAHVLGKNKEFAEAATKAKLGPLLLDPVVDVELQQALSSAGTGFAVQLCDVSRFVRLHVNFEGREAEAVLMMDLSGAEDRDQEVQKKLLAGISPKELLRAALGLARGEADGRGPGITPGHSGRGKGSGSRVIPAHPSEQPTLERVLRACIDSRPCFEKIKRLVEARPDVKDEMPYWDGLCRALDQCDKGAV
jgi:hypothetical protein